MTSSKLTNIVVCAYPMRAIFRHRNWTIWTLNTIYFYADAIGFFILIFSITNTITACISNPMFVHIASTNRRFIFENTNLMFRASPIFLGFKHSIIAIPFCYGLCHTNIRKVFYNRAIILLYACTISTTGIVNGITIRRFTIALNTRGYNAI